MRMIDRSTAFKRDYKRIKATPRYRKDLDFLLSDILKFLLADKVKIAEQGEDRNVFSYIFRFYKSFI